MKLFRTICFATALLATLVSGVSAQTVVDFSAGGTMSAWFNVGDNGGAVIQVFTVPAGYVGTRFEIYCEQGGYNNGGYGNLAIWNTAGHILMGVQSTSTQELTQNGTQSGGWLVESYGTSADNTTSLYMPAGTYASEVWSNSSSLNNRMHMALYTNCTYSGGYAAAGWSPGTQIGANQNFLSRVTLQAVPAVPEPGSIVALALGLSSLGGMLLKRRTL